MKLMQKSVVYEAEKYKPGMEDGFIIQYHDKDNPKAYSSFRYSETDIETSMPYILVGEYQDVVFEGDWILTSPKGNKHRVNEHFISDYDQVGNISDGYHTFSELYYHRMILFSIICNQNKEKAWKSWLHSDGTMFSDCFIAGIETPEGNYTYHFEKGHWDKFKVTELDRAPEWDGHKPEDVDRLFSLL